MKKTRLNSAALLSAILLVSTSCGAESGTVDTTQAVSNTPVTEAVTEVHEPTESELHPIPVKDMEGQNLRFYNYNDQYITWAVVYLDADSENGDNINDAIYRRNSKIEEQYNCVITEEAVTDTHTDFRKLMMSGEDLYDIVMAYDEHVSEYYCSGLIRPWSVLPYVDTSLSWWSQNANSVFSIQGKQFAAVGDFSLGMASRGFVMLFNKDLYAQLDMDESLYDMVRNNRWTLDSFAKVTKDFARDLDGNGVMDEKDMYATTGAIKLHFGSLVTGCGVKYIELDKDGVPYFAIPGNTYAMDVFQKVFDIHNGTNVYYKICGDVHSGSTESRVVFNEGRTLFQGTSTKGIAYYRDTDFDIGIIPYPKYDSNQEEYCILTSGTAIATIPITLPDEKCENVS
ncbi:MAG: hypothetical protein MJ175_13220, partial [Clostridia bacterium]|nr:hypothetical protein [Clostridia bacterium]